MEVGKDGREGTGMLRAADTKGNTEQGHHQKEQAHLKKLTRPFTNSGSVTEIKIYRLNNMLGLKKNKDLGREI